MTTWWPSARRASIGCSKPPGGWTGNRPRLRRRGRASCSRSRPTSTGTSTFPTSTSAARSTTSASVLDGYSRYIVHWELRESMTEQRRGDRSCSGRLEKYPGAKPRIISDNGPQFIARDFKEFIRLTGMTHVRTSPYYPQSNGKLERWHGSLKRECIRPTCPASLDEARRRVDGVRRALQPRAAAPRHRLHHARPTS